MGMLRSRRVVGLLTYIVAFLLSLVVSLVLTPIVRWMAHRFQWVDAPDGARKVHQRAIPRVGGIAIAIAFFVPVFGLFFIDNGVSQAYLANSKQVIGLVAGSILIIGLGLFDDVKGLGAKFKFTFEIVLAIGAFYLDYRIDSISNPFGPALELGWFALPITVLWIVGIINAINLIDGLDGLAGGVSLITVLTLFAVSLFLGKTIVGLTSIALAGALIGFLWYNFNPASIFMGDSGSLFLGFILSITAISGASRYSTVVSLLIPVLALGLPILDTGMSVLRRFMAGKPLFGADRGHIHHKLLDLGLSQKQVVLALYGFCALTGLGALSMVYADSQRAAIVLGAISAIVISFSRSLGYLKWKNVSTSVQYGLMRQQRLRVHLNVLEDASKAMETATDRQEVQHIFATVGDSVGLDLIELHARVGPISDKEVIEFEWAREEGTQVPTETLHQIAYPLKWTLGEVIVEGRVSFTWYCKEDMLQVPERVCYQLLATKTRDRLIHMYYDGTIHQLFGEEDSVAQ